MNSQKRNLGIGIVALLLLIGLYFVFDTSKEKKENTALEDVQATQALSADTASTTIVDLGGGITTTVPKGYTVEMVKGSGVPQPIASLTRVAVFAPGVDPRVKTLIETKVPELQAVLKKDPTKFDYWIDLGTYFKVAGDYAGAKLYWDYAGKLAPTDYISYGNLANMYAYYLKDMVNAEKYYNQAIKNGPTQSYLYIQLAESYRDVSKDIVKARAVVEKGLQAIPNNPALLELKNTFN
ncbi:MAG: hypothetical protein NTV02_01140 [Candidatus Zambryskibacteria bacterium]|nr:hypothetical protein [Candidatus Zambryskibacteria bacterium]